MTWLKIDDGFWRHRKVRRLRGDRLAAVGLWTLAGDWSADNLTDGFVPHEILEAWGDDVPRLTARLVEVGLWERAEVDAEPGVQFHEWDEHQPTREQVLTRRRDDAERKARSRERRRSEQVSHRDTQPDTRPDTAPDVRWDAHPDIGDVTSDVTPDVHPESHRESAPPDPTRPDPTRTSPSGEVAPPDGGAARATREGPDAIRSDRGRRRRKDASVVELARGARSAQAHRLVEDYAEVCKLRPGPRLLTSLGVEVDALLSRGWPEDVLADCITAWAEKGLGPSAFQSVANEVANRAPRTRASPVATTDRKFAEAQALKERLRDITAGREPRASAGGTR